MSLLQTCIAKQLIVINTSIMIPATLIIWKSPVFIVKESVLKDCVPIEKDYNNI